MCLGALPLLRLVAAVASTLAIVACSGIGQSHRVIREHVSAAYEPGTINEVVSVGVRYHNGSRQSVFLGCPKLDVEVATLWISVDSINCVGRPYELRPMVDLVYHFPRADTFESGKRFRVRVRIGQRPNDVDGSRGWDVVTNSW
jgi:hypothetical protein